MKKTISVIFVAVLLCALTISICGCTSYSRSTAYLDEASASMLEAGIAENYNTAFVENPLKAFINDGGAAEVFEPQADGLTECGEEMYTYTLAEATVIIAVDTDKTDSLPRSFAELAEVDDIVSMTSHSPEAAYFMSAAAYALGFDASNPGDAAELFCGLYDRGLLKFDDTDAAIMIMFDCQAAALIKSGRNLKIIVPSDGTLTTAKLIISHSPTVFAADAQQRLISAGFRLPDGSCDESIYPPQSEYASAIRADSADLNMSASKASPVMFRQITGKKILSTSGGAEHSFSALLMIVIATVWTWLFIIRSTNRLLSKAAFLTGLCIVLWISVRFIKWQLDAGPLNRYLWYSFYIFMLIMPMLLLLTAIMIDKQDKKPPKWWKIMLSACFALTALVFTNDLHQLVFKFDLGSGNEGSKYSYGVGYFLVYAVFAGVTVAAVIILCIKSSRSPRKFAVAFPIAVGVLLFAYGAMYTMKVTVIFNSDFTLFVCFLTLLFYEAAIQTGLIPINAKYGRLFKYSPLNMQIIMNDGTVCFSAKSATTVNEDVKEKILSNTLPVSFRTGDEMLYADSISGGAIIWKEDITEIQRLQDRIEESVKKLTAANTVLEKEQQIKAENERTAAKKELYDALDRQMHDKLDEISGLADELSDSASDDQRRHIIADINLIACFIKRRCALLFWEMQNDTLSSDEHASYMYELTDAAKEVGINCIASFPTDGQLRTSDCSLIYDFLFCLIRFAESQRCTDMIFRMTENMGKYTFTAISSVALDSFHPDNKTAEELKRCAASYSVKDLGDAQSITLSSEKEARSI